jgi:hypothetical protein
MDPMKTRFEEIESLVNDCIISNNSIILVQLIVQLEKDYRELAQLATFGEYKNDWTHEQVLDYITEET